MKHPFCYIISRVYEEQTIRPTLKESLFFLIKHYNNASYYHKYPNPIKVQYTDNETEFISILEFIKEKVVTEEEIASIIIKIDGEIKKTEEIIANLTHPVTGYFGITRDRREDAINNEIYALSYEWDMEKINNLTK